MQQTEAMQDCQKDVFLAPANQEFKRENPGVPIKCLLYLAIEAQDKGENVEFDVLPLTDKKWGD